jgi:pyruvate/2-oxoglutarate/acetoin dehydrogenase E1 component
MIEQNEELAFIETHFYYKQHLRDIQEPEIKIDINNAVDSKTGEDIFK